MPKEIPQTISQETLEFANKKRQEEGLINVITTIINGEETVIGILEKDKARIWIKYAPESMIDGGIVKYTRGK